VDPSSYQPSALPLRPHRLTLRFPPAQEKAFLEHYHAQYTRSMRTLALLTAISCALIALRLVQHHSEFDVSKPVRLLFGAEAVVLASTLRRRWVRYIPIALILIFLINTNFVNLVMKLPAPVRPLGFGAMLISVFSLYALCRVRFLQATVLGWLITFRYLGLALHNGVFPEPGYSMVAGYFFSANLVGMCAAYLLEYHARKDFVQQVEIEQERERANSLLLSILPEPIADRLKAEENPISDYFADVTVLFADIVGFTSLCQEVPPDQLVQVLNELFSRFDRLAEEEGVEKIKTIGDAYMAVAGLPMPQPDHAERVLRMALRMQEATGLVATRFERGLRIRIGVHSGPVIAGVIGRKRFIYDLWGDTVNIASRVETSSAVGEIRVSAATRSKAPGSFIFSPAENVPLKGVGATSIYRLIGQSQSPPQKRAA
jgi:class 3 adenylate cyclase